MRWFDSYLRNLMSFLAQVKIRWIQPEEFLLEEDQRSIVVQQWWLRPLIIFVFTVLSMLIWCGNKFLLHKDVPSFWVAIVLFLSMFWFLFYGWPWLLRLRPSVVLYSNSIMGMGESHSHSFKEFSGFDLSSENSYYVLRLTTKKGRCLLYGVPDVVTRNSIEAVLSQAGLSKISAPPKPDFAARRKEIWGDRTFTAAEVKQMREAELEGEQG